MSGIYIPDMEMPRTCAKCPLGHINAKRYAIECYAEYPTKLFDYDLARHSMNPFCPLIPVHDHGRLIDADELQQIIVEDIEEYSELDENGLHSGQWCGLMTAKMEIEAMPIVIGNERTSNIN